MTFYANTMIEYWQSREQSALRVAFLESRKHKTLSRGDRELPKGRFRHDLLAVNSFSRRIWGQAISNELSRFFCDGGDGSRHNRNVYFVSLMDVNCARSPEQQLTGDELEIIKNRLRFGLRDFSYFGMVEPAYYVNLQPGVRYEGKRCLSWHLHALVWGVSEKDLKKRLRKLVKRAWYSAIADGLDATHTRKIKQGQLPKHVGYVLKSPCRTYRVSVQDREGDQGRPFTNGGGVVLPRFRQSKSRLRHGDRIVLFHAIKHLHLDKLAVAGGSGAQLLRNAKRVALRADDRLMPMRRPHRFLGMAEHRRRKLGCLRAAQVQPASLRCCRSHNL
jgi:hypothetical protein